MKCKIFVSEKGCGCKGGVLWEADSDGDSCVGSPSGWSLGKTPRGRRQELRKPRGEGLHQRPAEPKGSADSGEPFGVVFVDPWSEAAASLYFDMDRTLGSQSAGTWAGGRVQHFPPRRVSPKTDGSGALSPSQDTWVPGWRRTRPACHGRRLPWLCSPRTLSTRPVLTLTSKGKSRILKIRGWGGVDSLSVANLWLASHSFGLFVEITSVDKGSEALGGYPILLLGAPMGGVLETCQENRLITCLGPTLLNWKMRRLNGASPRSNVHINILGLACSRGKRRNRSSTWWPRSFCTLCYMFFPGRCGLGLDTVRRWPVDPWDLLLHCAGEWAVMCLLGDGSGSHF